MEQPMYIRSIPSIIFIMTGMFLFFPTTYSQDTSNPVIIEQHDTLDLILVPELDSVKDSHPAISQPESSSKQLALVNRKIVFKKLTPQKKYAMGTKITKAGLITGIIASGLISATILYAFTNFDPWGAIVKPVVAGISLSVVSIQLTTTGFIIKGINKRKIRRITANGQSRERPITRDGDD